MTGGIILQLLARLHLASPYSYSIRAIGRHPRRLGVDLDFMLPRARPAFPASNSVIKNLGLRKNIDQMLFKKPLLFKRIKKYHQKILSVGYCCQVLFDYHKVPSIKIFINLEEEGSKVQYDGVGRI